MLISRAARVWLSNRNPSVATMSTLGRSRQAPSMSRNERAKVLLPTATLPVTPITKGTPVVRLAWDRARSHSPSGKYGASGMEKGLSRRCGSGEYCTEHRLEAILPRERGQDDFRTGSRVDRGAAGTIASRTCNVDARLPAFARRLL